MTYWPRYLPPAIERFEAKIVRVPEAGCWIWMGACNPNGYGRFRSAEGKTMLAHRFSYEHYRGPILDTAFACHYCDVPSCCNPAHLFIGTQKDNMADAKEKGRISAGEHHPFSVLTAQEVRAIRAATGRQKEIADVYGVHQVTISKIKRGLLWSHLKS